MYIIEKLNEERPFFYGVFLTEAKAAEHLEVMKTDSDDYYIKEIPIHSFPLYPIDYFNRMEYCTKKQMRDLVEELRSANTFMKLKDEDDQVCIIFRLKNEFAYMPGTDILLMHHHCTKSFFRTYKKYRKKFLRNI